MDWVDLFAIYLYGVKYLALATAMVLALLSLDDFLLDMSFWGRWIWRRLTIYRRYPRAKASDLPSSQQKPIVIMIPAWQESEVIGQMADAAAHVLDYENYHIFIGTYPNDPATQAEVDTMVRHHPNVHKVVCAQPGPTSKADCLNNVIAAVFAFEQRLGIEFAGFVLHDAEDVIPPEELRIFNYLLAQNDLIQLPVYPLPRPLTHWTSGHYIDEFTEQHGKDVVIREALARQVPSAGVGTCFSRRALLSLMRERDALPFDTQSLTEDYDISIRLARRGMREIFVRIPVKAQDGKAPGVTVAAIREYFPERFSAAVRQKSRWIIGIALQGWVSLRWSDSFWMNYFLWRDRRGLMGHTASFLANLIFLHILLILLYQWIFPDGYRFLSIFMDDPAFVALLWLNGWLMLNRIVQRMIFVTEQYGPAQGLMSAPRIVWSNLINFCATARALWQFIRAPSRARMAWDKTSHQFPEVAGLPRVGPLGERAVARGWLTEKDLDHALTARLPAERLGQTLLRMQLLTPMQLATILAEQAGVAVEDFDPRRVSPEQIRLMPPKLGLKYAVFPLREREDGTLLLARESMLPPIQLNALRRRLGRPVAYVIVPQGTVTTALRQHYHDEPAQNPQAMLDAAVSSGAIGKDQAERLWDDFVHRQILFGDLLLGSHRIQPAVLHQALLGYEDSDLPIGRYLVEAGYLGENALQEALEAQRLFQPRMQDLLRQYGLDVPDPRPGALPS